MATAQSVIDSARYDLLDFVDGSGLGIEFDDAELLNYLNRMIGLMDSALSSLCSDLVLAIDDSFTTTANLDYVDVSTLNSGNWLRIRRIWIDNNDLIEQCKLSYMYYTRRYRSTLLTSGDSIASGDYIKIVSQSTLDFTGIGAGDNNNGTYFTANAAGTLGSGDAAWKFNSSEPSLWALHDNKVLWETAAGSVKNLLIEYDKKTAALELTDNMPYTSRFDEFFREMVVAHAKAKKEGVVDKSDIMWNDMFRQRAMQEEISRGFVPKAYPYWEF
jgi:hypothetical protein